jgi:hypothetical protein
MSDGIGLKFCPEMPCEEKTLQMHETLGWILSTAKMKQKPTTATKKKTGKRKIVQEVKQSLRILIDFNSHY